MEKYPDNAIGGTVKLNFVITRTPAFVFVLELPRYAPINAGLDVTEGSGSFCRCFLLFAFWVAFLECGLRSLQVAFFPVSSRCTAWIPVHSRSFRPLPVPLRLFPFLSITYRLTQPAAKPKLNKLTKNLSSNCSSTIYAAICIVISSLPMHML
jgi:hypothetical protein